MAVTLVKRPLTVEQFNRMVETRILPEHDRLELIEGDIVEMAPIGSGHAAHVDRLRDAFLTLAVPDVIPRVQGPVQLTRVTRVEPDLALLRRRPDVYAAALPRPDDILLVVEVADNSLQYDREIKIAAYARAGIAEAWLIDLRVRRHFDETLRELPWRA